MNSRSIGPEDKEFLSENYRAEFISKYLKKIRTSIFWGDDSSLKTREKEAELFFSQMIDEFQRDDKSKTMEDVGKDFVKFFEFKLQIAARRTQTDKK
jgi:hypothetical protein